MSLLKEILCVLVFFVGMAIAAHFDAQDAEITAQIEQEVYEEKMAVMHVVCATWICQKYHAHEPCGRNSNTACTSAADLTRR